LLPLRKAFLCYPDLSADFPVVILAAYSLMLVVVFLLLFSKDDVLKLIPSHTPFFIWLEKKIEYYYYPVFFFFMGLLILANSYVGYSNLAWFLIFAVPASASLFYLLFITHNYIRKHAVYIFMEEEDEDISDKFEHAKTYYGFFVIFSFILLFFTTFFFIARIWGVEYSPSDIWKLLAESWVIPLGGGNNLGVIQFVMIILFVLAGFVLSSLVYKFVLNKLFEILRSEPGIQNTISRITHYTIIALAFTLGLAAIHLEQFIVSIAISLGIAIGWAGKDFVSDFIAGFIVLIERPIEIGNYIKLDSFEGTVHKIAARSTTIITSRNHSIVIPNKDLINKNIDNWSYSRFAVGFEVNIRVDLKSDPDLVKKTLLTVIQGNTAVLKVPNVVVRLEEIEADALYFLTRAFISSRRIKDQWTLAADLRTEIFKVFKANNIQFARPQRVVGFNFEGDRSEAQKPLEIKFGK
jgi:small-conductance mechanosensitive channel